MASNLPQQPYNVDFRFSNFSEAVKHYMKERGFTQAELVRRSGLSKTKVSRIYRNNNDKGSSYKSEHQSYAAVCLAFKLNREEAAELYFIAFPEMSLLGRFLDDHLSVMQANEVLHDLGLDLYNATDE